MKTVPVTVYENGASIEIGTLTVKNSVYKNMLNTWKQVGLKLELSGVVGIVDCNLEILEFYVPFKK